MSVSIYYSASRQAPLSSAEKSAVDAAVARHPLFSLMDECGVAESEFDGEDFCVYPAEDSETGVVFEGATKLPLCSQDAMWMAVQNWCQLLTEVRHALPDSTWRVHIDDRDIPWVEELQAFDPSSEVAQAEPRDAPDGREDQ